MDSLQVNKGKLVYLLSTCTYFSDKFFAKLIKKFERDSVVCMKYFYEIWVVMDIDKKKDSKNFILKSVCTKFMGSAKNSFEENMQYELLNKNNNLTLNQMTNIKKKYSTLIQKKKPYTPYFEDHCKKNLYTLINMINKYSKSNKYQYFFTSFILDYSQDSGIVHQCGLLIDLKLGEFIFYEPYGTYSKYNYKYDYSIEELLNIYIDVVPEKFKLDGRIKYTTFHNKFNDGKVGIQNMILNTNNNSDFKQKYDEILGGKIKTSFKDLYDHIMGKLSGINNKRKIQNTDNTVNIISIIGIVNDWDNRHSKTYWSDEKKTQYYSLWDDLLWIYYRYNSKSCVSITIVEMNNLFKGENPKEYIKSFQGENPNKKLTDDLYSLLDEFYPTFNMNLQKNNNTQTICKSLNKSF